ncbi:unnamed protein product [Hermetia illucens]|uniref:RNA polymerase II subunit A C-terminal domain phosphatase n=2 Tax=Hermetia illucens TaxID=343691 RepID=A0A7R8YLD9_HERIL|nr:unnamed protein product [Hermetia illucens]
MVDKNVVLSPAEEKIKIIKWRVKEGHSVTNLQVILLYEECGSESKEAKKLKSNSCGVVKKCLFADGAVVEKGSPILELSACIHTTVIKDMCADCGADLRRNENGMQTEASVPMVHSVPELKVTQKLAQELGRADTKRLLEERKLVLLVDLDQTLIHTTNDNVPANIGGIHHFQLYGPSSPWYHTKLRPGTDEFLTKISSLYELHICTFGARNYAHTIAQLLDKDGKLFSHRILSRDECFNITSKTDNLKALFPCGDSMVCIIDDREDVWNMAPNLIQVKPYHFFQHTGDINAPPEVAKHELDGSGVDFKDFVSPENNATEVNKSKSEPGEEETKESCSKEEKSESQSGESNSCSSEKSETKEDDETDKKTENVSKSDDETVRPRIEGGLVKIDDPDDYLLYLETILKNIHENFYSVYDESKEIPDLKALIPRLRAEVLRGKTLVFSGLVPNNMKLEQSRAFMIARSLGANVHQHITDEATHLVAATAGTFKVNAARKNRNIHIVTPDWLWCCAERWEHVNERLFPLDPQKPSKMRQPPPHCHSPEHIVNYNEKLETSPEENSIEPKFIDTINPLLSFSNADLAAMNQEFNQFFESESSSEDEHANIEFPPLDKNLRKRKREEEKEERQRNFFSRKENSLFVMAGEKPTENEQNSTEDDEDESPSVKFRRGEGLPSDLELGSDSDHSDNGVGAEDDGDWNMMGAALEREFLGLE